MYRSPKIALTKEQRAQLDERVFQQVAQGIARQQGITEQLKDYLTSELPKRDDYYRYVDQALARLKRDNRITLLGGGHYGWRVKGDGRGKRAAS